MTCDPRAGRRERSADERPSVRVATAAAMLRHGGDPHEIAEVTAVPLALVQLLAAEHPTPRTSSPSRTPPPGARGNPTTPRPASTARRARRRPRRTSLHCTAGTAMIANLGLALAAAALHLPALGWACALLSAPLFAIMLLATTR